MPAARTAMNMGNFAMESMESGDVIAVVIPCYKVRRHVLQVIDAIENILLRHIFLKPCFRQ